MYFLPIMQCISSFGKNSPLLTFNICVYSHLQWRLRSFGVIRIRMSDPRSVWVMSHQRNRWIHSGHGFLWLDRSWITDPDPDHPKGTQPKFITIRILEHIDTLWNFLEFSARRDSLRCVDWLQRLKLEINCLRLQFNFFATFNCDVLFTRKGLKASKNEWIEAYMSFWTLPIPTSCKLKL